MHEMTPRTQLYCVFSLYRAPCYLTARPGELDTGGAGTGQGFSSGSPRHRGPSLEFGVGRFRRCGHHLGGPPDRDPLPGEESYVCAKTMIFFRKQKARNDAVQPFQCCQKVLHTNSEWLVPKGMGVLWFEKG